MKTNIFFLILATIGAAIIINTYRHLTESERIHCLVTATDKDLCQGR